MRAGPVALAGALAAALVAAAGGAAAQSLTDMDWVVLEPSIGVSHVNVVAFSQGSLLPGIPEVNYSTAWGPTYGLTAGMRFSIVTVAAHLDFSQYSPYDVGTLGGRIQVHIPTPVIKPFVRLGAGYAWLGALNPASAMWTCSPGSTSNDCPSVNGWSASLGAGLDFAVKRWFTVGAGLDFTLLNLNRSASPTMVGFGTEGSSMGFQLALNAQAAFRF